MNQLYHLVRYNIVNISLYWLTNRVNLSLTVSLNKGTKDGGAKFCYMERPAFYGGINAYVDLDWSMRLRDIYSTLGSADFRITAKNLYQFIHTIRTMKIWFTDLKHNDLFLIDKANKIYRCNPAYKPLVTINQFNEKLELTPTIIIDSVGDHIPGVQIIINTNAEPIFLKIQDYLNFDLFISQLNPTMMAMQLLTMFNAGPTEKVESQQLIPKQIKTNNSQRQSFLSMAGATKKNDS